MGLMRSTKDAAVRTLVSGGHTAIRRAPDSVLNTSADWFLRDVPYPDGRDFLKTILLLTKRNLHKMSPEVQRSILNFVANILFKGERKRQAFKTEMGFDPPVLLVISPSMRCNLKCYGCYAGKYSRGDDLGLGVLDRLLHEAEDMGIYFITITGGEPFILGYDLLEMLGRHQSIMFQVYTNGTLIDRDMAVRLARTGNVYPCISVEGYAEETDARRGEGTFHKIMSAMDDLRDEGVLFGFSATATRENNELICSQEFIDFYRRKGCMVGWYFHYVPVGREPGVEFMPTAEQRVFRREEIIKRRSHHNILLADFWNDGPMVGGCLAGGRTYLHINSDGEVEPCVFAHFAVDNIWDKPLRDILQSPFFVEIRKRQPYDKNMLRPCMIIDVPEVLRDVVTVCGAHPTHPGAEAVIDDFASQIDTYSQDYKVLADQKWSEFNM